MLSKVFFNLALPFFAFILLADSAFAGLHRHNVDGKMVEHTHTSPDPTTIHTHPNMDPPNMDPKVNTASPYTPHVRGPNLQSIYTPNPQCNHAIQQVTQALTGIQGNLASSFGQQFGGISPYMNAGVQAVNLYSQQLQQVDAARDKAFDAQEQINQGEFEQITQFQDKQHELRKSFYQMQRELIKTEAEMNSEKRRVESACDQEAETNYAALVEKLSGLSGAGQFQANNSSNLSGTRGRMRRQRRIFFARCLAKQTTQNTLSDIADKYKAIYASLQNQSKEIQADIDYQEVKINQVYAENDRQRDVASQVHSLDTDRKISRLQFLSTGLQMFGQGGNNPLNNSFTTASAFNGVSNPIQEFHQNIQICQTSQTLRQATVPGQLVPYYQQLVAPCGLRCQFVPVQSHPGVGGALQNR